jgi:hypothetical protein
LSTADATAIENASVPQSKQGRQQQQEKVVKKKTKPNIKSIIMKNSGVMIYQR